MLIENMQIAPIIGSYNQNTIELAKKIAVVYNESVNNVDQNLFLGFKFNLIPELKSLKASLNFFDSLIEINVNENSKIIIPSLNADEHTISRLFEFYDYNNEIESHVILEHALNNKSLNEITTLKGKASRFIKSKVKSGVESAKKIINKEIEITNPDSINDLCNNINRDLNKIIIDKSTNKHVVDTITNFVRTGDASNIDALYNVVFNSGLESKYAKKCNDEVYKLFKMQSGEFNKGKSVQDKIIKQIISKSYETTESFIDDRNDDNPFYVKQLKKLYKFLSMSINTIFNVLKGSVYTLSAYTTFKEGIAGLTIKVLDYLTSGMKNLVQYILGPSESDVSMAQALSKSEGWIDKGIGYFNIAIQKGMTKGLDTLDTFKTSVLDISAELTSKLESLPYINILKFTVTAGLGILALIAIKNIIKDYIEFSDEFKTKSSDAIPDFAIDSLTSNGGFDKVFITESIIAIITTHITSALEHSTLSHEEKSRLKKLNHAFYNSHKKKTKEGIKFFFESIENINKEV